MLLTNLSVHNYRCRFNRDYARTEEHPTCHVAEEHVVPGLDACLATLFSEGKLDEFVAALFEDADPAPRTDVERLEASITDCDANLRHCRAALDNGAKPVTVTTWINETLGRKRRAEFDLGALDQPVQPITPEGSREASRPPLDSRCAHPDRGC